MATQDTVLQNFLPQLKDFIKSETVFGEPYHVGEVTLIPVNAVRVGFGYGKSELTKSTDSTGGGGAVSLNPVAFVVIRGQEVTIQSLATGTVENVMEKAPEFMEKTITLLQGLMKKKEQA